MAAQGTTKGLARLEAIDLIGVRFDGWGAVPGRQLPLPPSGRLAWRRPYRSGRA